MSEWIGIKGDAEEGYNYTFIPKRSIKRVLVEPYWLRIVVFTDGDDLVFEFVDSRKMHEAINDLMKEL